MLLSGKSCLPVVVLMEREEKKAVQTRWSAKAFRRSERKDDYEFISQMKRCQQAKKLLSHSFKERKIVCWKNGEVESNAVTRKRNEKEKKCTQRDWMFEERECLMHSCISKHTFQSTMWWPFCFVVWTVKFLLWFFSLTRDEISQDGIRWKGWRDIENLCQKKKFRKPSRSSPFQSPVEREKYM